MGFTRSRTLGLVAWLVLSALALRGASGIERALELVFAPARAIGELALPFRIASRGGPLAAPLAGAEHAEGVARSRALLVDAQNAALPRDPNLARARSLCVARVIGRVERRADAIVVRAPPDVVIEPGMGVVCGDAYVGRVESLARGRTDEAIVALVTGREFRVRARVIVEDSGASSGASERSAAEGDADVGGAEGRETAAEHAGDGDTGDRRDSEGDSLDRDTGARGATEHGLADGGREARSAGASSGADRNASLVVGGLAVVGERSRGLHLAAHVPSDRSVRAGAVVVDEPASEPLGAFVAGFRLGELCAYDANGVSTLAVRAAIDYADGLSWVALVAGPERAMAGDVLAEDPFDERSWTDARVLVPGDATGGSSSRSIVFPVLAREHGADERVRAGAALACGTRFVGRVISVGMLRADVALLGDPRLELDVLARVEGLAAPVSLGRVRSIRALRGGSIELAWDPRVPIAMHADVARAEIFTAAGESDVPAGLFVGRCDLPRGEGPFRLRLEPAAGDVASVTRARAWIGRRTSGGGSP